MVDNSNSFENVGRRTFLGLAAIAPAALTAPAAKGAIPSHQVPPLLKSVISFISRSFGDLHSMHMLEGRLQRHGPVIEAPPNYGRNVGQVVDTLQALRMIGYGCSALRENTFSGLSIADFKSAEWDALEQEWWPVVKEGNPNGVRYSRAPYFDCRQGLTKALQEYGFPETVLLSDAADIIEAHCLEAIHTIIRQSYQYDPVGFVHKFHADGANVGLMLHQQRKGEKQDIERWIPSSIADHIEAMYPFSGWAKGRKIETPTGLNKRFFSVGQDNQGRQLFQIALSIDEARKAMVLLLGQDLTDNLALQETGRGGIILKLAPDQYNVISDKLINLLPTEAPPMSLPLSKPVSPVSAFEPKLG